MAAKPQRTPAHQSFINCLYHFYINCGNPSWDAITETAGRIKELYPEFGDSKNDSGLSRANLYKILKGRHDRLPTTAQVGSLVLSLQHLAHAEKVIRDDPGCASLPEWHALLAETRVLDMDQKRAGVTAAADSPPHPVAPSRLPRPVPADAAEAAAARTRCEPVPLTDVEMHFVTALGAYGRLLALRSTGGDPGVLYELAIMLATGGSPYDRRAAAIAANAAAAGLPAAADLLSADGRVDPGPAAVKARDLAYAAAKYGDAQAASAFSACFTRVGTLDSLDRAPTLGD